MFTLAALMVIGLAISVYAVGSAWWQGKRREAAMFLIGVAIAGSLAFVAIRGLINNKDPMNLIRQPMPCSVRTG